MADHTRIAERIRIPVGTAVAILSFLFAVQLLGAATDTIAPLLRGVFASVPGDSAALGFGWLGAYLLTNGSVVAALSLSLFEAGLVPADHLFLLLVGSRLGGSAVVVLVGLLEYVHQRSYSLQRSLSMGLLTFVLTLSVYLPAALVGYLALPILLTPTVDLSRGMTLGGQSLSVFGPAVTWLTALLGPIPSYAIALTTLLGSLSLFDRMLRAVETDTLRERVFSRLERRWVAFGTGLVLTTVTTSVAFSVGVVVPLYNRKYVKRTELVPYILGANLGTLFDTLVVAIVLETPVGVATVLVVLAVGTVVTLFVLVLGDHYIRWVERFDDRLLDDRRAFLTVVIALSCTPLALVLWALLVG